MARPYRLLHEPALDGLRAIAVLLVIVFHALPNQVPGGFLGVDVFFALSGYLITRLLLLEYQSAGRIDLIRFYWRRWWRLGPALMAMLAVYLLVSGLFLDPESWASRAQDSLWAVLYMANWARAWGWQPMVDLGHTWSLAVEEQYYLLWPVLLLALLKALGHGRKLLMVIALLALASAAWRVLLQAHGASLERLYNGTDVRAETLLWGSALAVWMHHWGPRRPDLWRAMAWGALLVLGLMVWTASWTASWMYAAGMTAVAWAALAIIGSLHGGPQFAISRVLRAWPLVGIGRISYGMYLWHFPIERGLLAAGVQGGWLLLSVLGLTLVVAALSFVWLEQPLLRWRDRTYVT